MDKGRDNQNEHYPKQNDSMNSLQDLVRAMRQQDVTRLYAKVLAGNDNSKNQVFLGSDFSVLNVIPAESATTHESRSRKGSDEPRVIFKARICWLWLLETGSLEKATGAQFILYPQYPEVRLSGFLKGCHEAPSTLMTSRLPGRVLFLGVRDDGSVVAYVAAPDTAIAAEAVTSATERVAGVLREIPLGRRDTRSLLLSALREVAEKGWIESRRLVDKQQWIPCRASHCGGYTLEAELGITPNGLSEPDFHGWEVKQHAVSHFDRLTAGVLTLMTPEPTGGFYRESGPEAFVRRFGYPDMRGRQDRLNFGGIHRFDRPVTNTGLTLRLQGFDHSSGRITDPRGALVLENDSGERAAEWSFEGLMAHWQRKHAQAVYVPSLMRKQPIQQYRYGHIVRLGVGTDFLRFLKAVAEGAVYYDPGIKLEAASTAPRLKRRNQFRVKSRDLSTLYGAMETVPLCQ